MRVFCPEHKRGFFAPRQSPIKCENRGHILGELNFAGETRTEAGLQWQYCCNCEHFCPISADGDSLQRCPVCTRRTSQLFICERCRTISFESNTPLQAKNFTLTAEGLPQPSCPACLQANSGEVREHQCDELGAGFTTALNSCPICRERLDVGPTFPSLVAPYLRRTKTANKLNVTFDFDSGLFVAVEDGEFVVVTNGADSKQGSLLPRLTRLSNTREFYEFYQDYYHHSSELRAGEVQINEPALVERSGEGWRFQSAGMLEVIVEQPRKAREKIRLSEVETPAPEQPAAPVAAPAKNKVTPGEIDTAAPEQPPSVSAPAREESPNGEQCSRCGSTVEERYAFCWHCGNPMKQARESAARTPAARLSPRRLVIDVDDASTVEPRADEVPEQIPDEPRKFRRRANSGLKLMVMTIIAGGTLLVVTLGAIWLRSSAATANSSFVAQAATANLQSDRNFVPTVEATDKPTVEPTQPIPNARPGEDELRKLRQRRLAATAADRPVMLRDSARLERQYPNDYRFPYERAKVAVMGTQAKSIETAFQALSLAAEKAIRAGKAQEMLQSLAADKTGDFQKLARGHAEWGQLVQALRSKDVKLLAANMHLAE